MDGEVLPVKILLENVVGQIVWPPPKFWIKYVQGVVTSSTGRLCAKLGRHDRQYSDGGS